MSIIGFCPICQGGMLTDGELTHDRRFPGLQGWFHTACYEEHKIACKTVTVEDSFNLPPPHIREVIPALRKDC